MIIYINLVELESLTLQAKFHRHTTSGSGEKKLLKGFTIFGRGGHLCHATWTIYTKFPNVIAETIN